MAMNTTAQTLVEIDKLLSEKVTQNIAQLKAIVERLKFLKEIVEDSEDDQNAILSASSDLDWATMKTMIDTLTTKINEFKL